MDTKMEHTADDLKNIKRLQEFDLPIIYNWYFKCGGWSIQAGTTTDQFAGCPITAEEALEQAKSKVPALRDCEAKDITFHRGISILPLLGLL